MGMAEVVNAVDKRELILFSQRLVRTPSVSGEEKAVGELVAKKLNQIGLEVEVVGGNVLGILEGSDSKRNLAICGHLDTVVAADPKSWTVDPYGADIKDGKLWGLGSADMKAALSAQITAIDAVRRASILLKGNILFIATILEEAGREKLALRKGIIEVIDKGLIKADAVIIGEPTNLMIARGHKGVCNIELITRGKSAHGSTPEKGLNAIEKMAEILMALKTLKLGEDPELGPGTLTPCVISGGIKISIVPDTCHLSIDRRLTVGESKMTVREEIETLVGKLKMEDPQLDVEVEYPYSYEAVITPADHPVLRSLEAAIHAVTGRPATVGFIPFGTDGAWINSLARIPVMIYGPGRVTDAHSPDECVELQQVEEASKAYAALLANYLS